jgi:hypothetical protein
MQDKNVTVQMCPTHPNYKGLRATKRDCKICQALYQSNKKKTNNKRPFKSITVPNMAVSIHHLIAELSCLQLYGSLPPYFWRKDSPCRREVKNFYIKILKMAWHWHKRKIPARNGYYNPIQAMQEVLFYTVSQYRVRKDLEQKQTVTIDFPKEKDPLTEAVDTDFGTRKKSKFEAMSDMGRDGEN